MAGEFRHILLKAAAAMGLSLSEENLGRFETYREILLLWNSRMNLVSLKSDLDLPVRHFIDSLSLLPFIPPGPQRLLDIGSGAGFPAIPVAIVRSNLHVVLLEANRKKCSFLKELGRKLELHAISVLNGRLEALLADKSTPAFDVIVSRATFNLPDFIALALPLLKKGGVLVAMKGPGVEDEIAALGSLNDREFRIVGDHSLSLPLTGDRRRILLVDKPA